jgi:uncharacterized Rmd1/YagE family protein
MANLPDIDALGTITTPVQIDTLRLELRADYFPTPIDLDLLASRYGTAQVLHADPLVLKINGNAHAVILRFGAVVFWQCDDAAIAKIVATIQQLPEMRPPYREGSDKIVVLVDRPEDRVNFRDICLQTLTLEHIKIISEIFGKSVALKHSEGSVSSTLNTTAPIVRGLEIRGALISSTKDIMKKVGFALSVREGVLAKLSLFDDPVETWQSERLARLHTLLLDHFDFKKRLEALKEKVTFLSDLNLMLLNLLQNRTSHRLEWIVILLIVIEVVISLMHFFAPGR